MYACIGFQADFATTLSPLEAHSDRDSGRLRSSHGTPRKPFRTKHCSDLVFGSPSIKRGLAPDTLRVPRCKTSMRPTTTRQCSADNLRALTWSMPIRNSGGDLPVVCILVQMMIVGLSGRSFDQHRLSFYFSIRAPGIPEAVLTFGNPIQCHEA